MTLAIGTNPAGGALSGTVSVTTVGGLATFSNVALDKAGTGYTLVASSPLPGPALTTATSSPFNVTFGTATQLVFVQQPTNAASGAAITPPVTVQLRDAAGNNVTSPERNVTVALGSNPGGGALSGTLTVATVNGLATFSNLSIDKVGNGYTLVASSPTPTPLTQATSSGFNVTAAAATQLVFLAATHERDLRGGPLASNHCAIARWRRESRDVSRTECDDRHREQSERRNALGDNDCRDGQRSLRRSAPSRWTKLATGTRLLRVRRRRHRRSRRRHPPASILGLERLLSSPSYSSRRPSRRERQSALP